MLFYLLKFFSDRKQQGSVQMKQNNWLLNIYLFILPLPYKFSFSPYRRENWLAGRIGSLL